LSGKSYEYSTRQGVLSISWEEFHGICKALALAASHFQPDLVLPVGRGGYYPGTLISHLLQVEPYPVRLTRRERDIPVYDTPQWIVEPPEIVRGRRVLVVDEICSSGETLSLVRQKVIELGAQAVCCAVLYAHTWGVDIPDTIGLVTNALVLNPWDREVLRGGEFVFHPEYVEALAKQGLEPDEGMCILAPHVILAKRII
jgi:uncharacterized protein